MRQISVMCDYQILIRQDYGGVSRYHYEILNYIKQNHKEVEILIPCLFNRNTYFSELLNGSLWRYDNKYLNYFVRILNEVYSFLFLIFRLFIGKPVDVVHITWYKPFYLRLYLKVVKNKPNVVMTVHDLIHEMNANVNPVLRRGANDRKRCFSFCNRIIAISYNTKADLIRFYPGLSNRNIDVIYHGYPKWDKDGLKKEKKLSQILFVGQRKDYKNFNSLIRALGILKKQGEIFSLICAGGGSFDKGEMDLIKKFDINECITQKYMTESELQECYETSVCFVYPSKYEGFGMPILEAFSSDCPVLLSNCSCFPEIAGDAAIYFNPNDAEDIANKIKMILNNQDVQNECIIKGKERLKIFSWSIASEMTLSVYLKKEGC